MKKNFILSAMLCTSILSTSSIASASGANANFNPDAIVLNNDQIYVDGISIITKDKIIALINDKNIDIQGNLNIPANIDWSTLHLNNNNITIQGQNFPKQALLEALGSMLDKLEIDEGYDEQAINAYLSKYFEPAGVALIKNYMNEGGNLGSDRQQMLKEAQEIFAENPELLGTFNQLLKMKPSEREAAINQPDIQALINSEEIIELRNSPEAQEYLKDAIKNAEEKIATLKAQGASQERINKMSQRYLDRFNSLGELFLTDTSKGVNKLSDLTPVQKPDTITTDSLLSSISSVTSIVDNRMVDMTGGAIGVSSGDESRQYGAWVKGMYTYAKQSEYKLVPGYKLNQAGATIGFDIGENPIFGIAYSFIDSKANSKNIGMKEKIKSHIGTIYGLYDLGNNIFIDGQARYGKSNIKKNRANDNVSNDTSHGKTKADLLGGKIELGYDYALENKVHLIPTLGVSYDEVKVKGYKETGEGLNRNVGKRTASKTSGIVGLSARSAIEGPSYTVIPEAHVNAIYALQTKNGKTTLTLFEGMDPITTPSNKTPKMSYKVGGSLKFIHSKMVDLGVGYDLGLSKKFYSHTGYLNARVNF